MNNIYDNGTVLLGTIKMIKEYIKNQLRNNMDVYHDDMKDILKDIEYLDDNAIVAINYDNGMGYTLEYWSERDIIKEGENNE